MNAEQAIYARRFAENDAYRTEVWKLIVRHIFQPYVPAASRLLDLGCGYGEFINNVRAAERYAMDANPDARPRLNREVAFIQQDSTQPWPFTDDSLDVIFSSNFFEHLPTKEALSQTLERAYRAVRQGGTLIAMGPNIRHLPGAYWDFIDHHIALTDRSMLEALELAGFTRERVVSRFLPYTMSDALSGKAKNAPLAMVDLYLRTPIVWRLFGKQFLIVMKKLA